MITGPDFKNVSSSLNKNKLADYWNGYFAYQNLAVNLYQITENELIKKISETKQSKGFFLDSQQVINDVLNDLGSKHNFHRQFSEKFPELHKEQILGMQLYWLMLTNEMIWVYTETQHAGHAFPHSTYFIPKKQVQKYVELCKNNGAIIP